MIFTTHLFLKTKSESFPPSDAFESTGDSSRDSKDQRVAHSTAASPRFNGEAEAVVYGQPQRQTDWSTSKGLLPIRAAEAPGSRQVHGPCPLQQTKVESSALCRKGGLPQIHVQVQFLPEQSLQTKECAKQEFTLHQV